MPYGTAGTAFSGKVEFGAVERRLLAVMTRQLDKADGRLAVLTGGDGGAEVRDGAGR
jgi:hypothetical protein